MNEPAIHPEATPDPLVLRWRYTDVVDTPEPGRVAAIPSSLAELGVVDIVSEPGALVLRLNGQNTWGSVGSDVRQALLHALTAGSWSIIPDAPTVDAPSVALDDDELAVGVRRLLAEDVGLVAASHGGSIELIDVTDGVVHVQLEGACRGCPAASMTLHRRLEDTLRHRFGEGVRVEAQGVNPASSRLGPRGRSLLQWPHERRR